MKYILQLISSFLYFYSNQDIMTHSDLIYTFHKCTLFSPLNTYYFLLVFSCDSIKIIAILM